MNRWHCLFIIIFIAGGGWLWASQVPADAIIQPRQSEPALYQNAPAFTLTALDGTAFSFNTGQDELLEKPIVLNFWATWCGPCQRELPALQAAVERYGDRVEIIGIDEGESATVVAPFVDQRGLTFTILLDSDTAVGTRYNVLGMPTTFFIDRQGVIRHIWTGEMNRITLAEGIARILK